MTSTIRIPHLLTPYVSDVPKDNLILLTSTLGTSVNWLIIRYLCGIFHNDAVNARAPLAQEELVNAEDVGVVLVSWMRDYEFWKTEARRAGQLDLPTLSQTKKFAFVDLLSHPPTSNDDLSQALASALSSLSTPSALLILDSPDLHFALQPSPQSLHNLILPLRLHPRVHAMVVSMAADVEVEPVGSIAYMTDVVVSARGLDTGAAGDVGGVLRVTREGEGFEVLFLVKTDGSVKVWERGAGVG